MSIIISKTFDGLVIKDKHRDCYKNIPFPNITSLHYLENIRFCYIFDNSWVEVYGVEPEEWKLIETHYDNYHINKITLELMKNDPISPIEEIEDRARQFYLKQKEK